MPAIGATVIAAVGSSDGMIVGQYVPVEFGGTMQVTAKPDSLHVTLQNSAECPENVIAGTVIPVGAIVGPPATFNMSGLVWNTTTLTWYRLEMSGGPGAELLAYNPI